jgi:hypothetical protein
LAQNPPDPDQPIAWRAVTPDEKVRSSDGTDAGTVFDVLGSNAEDIFHGIVVQLKGGPRVLVEADDVTLMTPSRVEVSFTAAQLHRLPPHAEDHEFHLGVTGRFRKHPGWIEDKDR